MHLLFPHISLWWVLEAQQLVVGEIRGLEGVAVPAVIKSDLNG